MAHTVTVPGNQPFKITQWKVKKGQKVTQGIILALYQVSGTEKISKLKCNYVGTVTELLLKEGHEGKPGEAVLKLEECKHPMVMKDMCAECGADLRRLKDAATSDKKDKKPLTSASVAMVHSVPELIVSEEQALELGRQDEQRLLKHRKLVLLVDLDQTLLHTTNDNIPPNLKDVHHFQLWHNRWIWYHTKFRPGTKEFLESISKLYELHICTFGVRMYAHTIASFLDPDKRYFSHRILSRDECFSANSKTANLRALFPCGDSMVCIIDDRDDVWKSAPNLIQVKPYHFFCGTADINAPPGLGKESDDGRSHRHNVNIIRIPKKKTSVQGTTANSGQVMTNANKKDRSDYKKSPTTGSVQSAEEVEQKETVPQTESVSNSTKKEPDLEKEKNNTDVVIAGSNDGPNNPTSDNLQSGDSQEGVTVEKSHCDNSIASSASKQQSKGEALIGDKSSLPDTGNSPAVSADQVSSSGDALDQISDDLEISDSSDNESEAGDSPAQPEESVASSCSGPAPCESKGANELEAVNSTRTAEPSSGQKESNENEDDNTSIVSSHGNRSTEKEEGEVTSEDDRCESDGKKPDVEEYDELIEWEDNDDYLIYLEDILKRIHKVYYKMYDEMKEKNGEELPDLKKIIPYIRSKVLKGANILFSGMVPTNQPLENSHAYRVAKSLGANVHSVFLPKDSGEENATTHLVAAKLGTSKVNQAKKHKVHIVNPDWLWSCMSRWEWVDERMFPLTDDAMYPFTDSPDPWKPKKTKPPKEGTTQSSEASKEDSQSSKTSPKASHSKEEEKFADYNPLYAFSSSDIKKMDEEVDEIFEESESEDSELELRRAVLNCGKKRQRESSSSEESLTAEYPKGWGHKKRTRLACRSSRGCDNDEEDSNDENNIEAEEMDDDENEIGRKIMEDPSSVIRLSDQSSSDDSDRDSDFNDSIGSIDDEMAAAVEREFLSN